MEGQHPELCPSGLSQRTRAPAQDTGKTTVRHRAGGLRPGRRAPQDVALGRCLSPVSLGRGSKSPRSNTVRLLCVFCDISSPSPSLVLCVTPVPAAQEQAVVDVTASCRGRRATRADASATPRATRSLPVLGPLGAGGGPGRCLLWGGAHRHSKCCKMHNASSHCRGRH